MQCVIGIGNEILADDGVGIYIIDQLLGLLKSDNVRLVKLESGGIDIISYLLKNSPVWIIDASSFGIPPGTIGRYTFDNLPLHHKIQISCHSSNLNEVIRMGYTLYPNEMPELINFILVEGFKFTKYNIGLSKPVLAAADEVINQFLELFKS